MNDTIFTVILSKIRRSRSFGLTMIPISGSDVLCQHYTKPDHKDSKLTLFAYKCLKVFYSIRDVE